MYSYFNDYVIVFQQGQPIPLETGEQFGYVRHEISFEQFQAQQPDRAEQTLIPAMNVPSDYILQVLIYLAREYMDDCAINVFYDNEADLEVVGSFASRLQPKLGNGIKVRIVLRIC